jgi:LDH2 family malate/lactate/ureidoglycolate dehydrogenase
VRSETVTAPPLSAHALRRFAVECLSAVDVRAGPAEIVADVLVAADLSGIDSHGVARLRRYVEGVASAAIDGRAEPLVVAEHAATAVLDARNGLGQPAAVAAMELAAGKAEACGIGMVAVRRTNHFGIAGYYASLAARHGLIGIVTTNATPQVAPTFAAEPLYGTNPIAIALPTGGETDFLFDAATSTVGRGKLEIRHRRGEPIPTGWVIDGTGAARDDVEELIEGLKRRRGYALLPLGGEGESHGGHKGYALGLFVDLLCGPLAGAAWGRHVYGADGANLGHCCIAIRVEAFRPLTEFQEECRRVFDEIRAAKRAPGAGRIFVPGEKEAEERRRRERDGIPLPRAVRDDLARLAADLDVSLEEVPGCG